MPPLHRWDPGPTELPAAQPVAEPSSLMAVLRLLAAVAVRLTLLGMLAVLSGAPAPALPKDSCTTDHRTAGDVCGVEEGPSAWGHKGVVMSGGALLLEAFASSFLLSVSLIKPCLTGSWEGLTKAGAPGEGCTPAAARAGVFSTAMNLVRGFPLPPAQVDLPTDLCACAVNMLLQRLLLAATTPLLAAAAAASPHPPPALLAWLHKLGTMLMVLTASAVGSLLHVVLLQKGLGWRPWWQPAQRRRMWSPNAPGPLRPPSSGQQQIALPPSLSQSPVSTRHSESPQPAGGVPGEGAEGVGQVHEGQGSARHSPHSPTATTSTVLRNSTTASPFQRIQLQQGSLSGSDRGSDRGSSTSSPANASSSQSTAAEGHTLATAHRRTPAAAWAGVATAAGPAGPEGGAMAAGSPGRPGAPALPVHAAAAHGAGPGGNGAATTAGSIRRGRSRSCSRDIDAALAAHMHMASLEQAMRVASTHASSGLGPAASSHSGPATSCAVPIGATSSGTGPGYGHQGSCNMKGNVVAGERWSCGGRMRASSRGSGARLSLENARSISDLGPQSSGEGELGVHASAGQESDEEDREEEGREGREEGKGTSPVHTSAPLASAAAALVVKGGERVRSVSSAAAARDPPSRPQASAFEGSLDMHQRRSPADPVPPPAATPLPAPASANISQGPGSGISGISSSPQTERTLSSLGSAGTVMGGGGGAVGISGTSHLGVASSLLWPAVSGALSAETRQTSSTTSGGPFPLFSAVAQGSLSISTTHAEVYAEGEAGDAGTGDQSASKGSTPRSALLSPRPAPMPNATAAAAAAPAVPSPPGPELAAAQELGGFNMLQQQQQQQQRQPSHAGLFPSFAPDATGAGVGIATGTAAAASAEAVRALPPAGPMTEDQQDTGLAQADQTRARLSEHLGTAALAAGPRAAVQQHNHHRPSLSYRAKTRSMCLRYGRGCCPLLAHAAWSKRALFAPGHAMFVQWWYQQ